jgi:hypothetical protein
LGGDYFWLEKNEGKPRSKRVYFLLSSARLGRRFGPLVNPNPLSSFDERVEEKIVVTIVHVPIARPSGPFRAGIFDQATLLDKHNFYQRHPGTRSRSSLRLA